MAREAAMRMYMDDVAAEEARVAAAWELIDGDEMDVDDGDEEEEEEAEDDDDKEEAEDDDDKEEVEDDDDKKEAEDYAKLRAAEAVIHVASTQREVELAAHGTTELKEHRLGRSSSRRPWHAQRWSLPGRR
jgi:hypothetical protein